MKLANKNKHFLKAYKTQKKNNNTKNLLNLQIYRRTTADVGETIEC